MADNQLNQLKQKLKTIFTAFLIPKCRISNDVYLEMLLTHLSGKYDKGVSSILQSEIVTEYLEAITQKWADSESPPNAAIVSFTLKLLALIVEDEWQFHKYKENNILTRIQECLKTNQKLQTPSIHLGNTILLSTILKHTIGVQWIKETKSWITILNYCQRNHTLYVVRAGMKFVYDILVKSSIVMKDISLTGEVIKEIYTTLNSHELSTNLVVSVDNSEFQKELTPTLNLIIYILTQSIESDDENSVAGIMLDQNNLECQMWKLADRTIDPNFLGILLKIFTLYNFAHLQLAQKLRNNVGNELNLFVVNFFNYMNFCITRRSSITVIKTVELNHLIWIKMQSKLSPELLQQDETINLGDQFMVLQLFPILFFIKKADFQKNECFDNYIMKLFNISSEHTTKFCYSFRELMRSSGGASEIASKSIQGIIALKDILPRNRAVMVFQALIFTLKEYAPNALCHPANASLASNTASTDFLAENPNMLSAILDGLHTLIQHYNITWKESLESTVLLNFMLTLLSNPNLTTRVAVQVLKLTQLSIEHFMAPNLALLVNTLKGSGMESLGPVIMKRLHDKEWEARDSTLELLTSMVAISELKFPAFQQHIFDFGICPVVVCIAKNDSEPYVRASALKCLTEMSHIRMFWDKCLIDMEIVAHLLTVISGESEGVVRREAVVFLTSLYKAKQIQNDYMNKVYSLMTYCTVNDLYWEVKTVGIQFWKTFFCHQGVQQGMIDGKFPNVTFSIEHKKIITLNHREIVLRIRNMLTECSAKGCLGVFLACLNDDDLEVVRLAVVNVQKLLTALEKFNYKEDSKNLLPNLPNEINEDTNYAEFKSPPKVVHTSEEEYLSYDTNGPSTSHPANKVDVVIDSIVDEDDVNLLTATYANLNSGDDSSQTSPTVIPDDYYKTFYISIDNFFESVSKQNLDEVLRVKSDWIAQSESCDSLLDDILLSFKDLNIDEADCY